jgi:NADPH:quinone reductase-like Zn-dependent oxidoreductase
MQEAWRQLSQWISEGHLHPVIRAKFPMDKASEAYRLLSEGHNYGKVVLDISS